MRVVTRTRLNLVRWKNFTREKRLEAAKEEHLSALVSYCAKRRLRQVIGNLRQHAIDRLYARKMRLTMQMEKRRNFQQKAFMGWRDLVSRDRELNFRSTISRTKADLRQSFIFIKNLMLGLEARNFRLAKKKYFFFRSWREVAGQLRGYREISDRLNHKSLAINFGYMKINACMRKRMRGNFLAIWVDHFDLVSLALDFFRSTVEPRVLRDAFSGLMKIFDSLVVGNLTARNFEQVAMKRKFLNFWSSETRVAGIQFGNLDRKFHEISALRALKHNARLARATRFLDRKFVLKNFRLWRIAPLMKARAARLERSMLAAWGALVAKIRKVRDARRARFFAPWKFQVMLRLHRKFHALNVVFWAWRMRGLSRKFSEISARTALRAWRDYAVVEWDENFPVRKFFRKFHIAVQKSQLRFAAAAALAEGKRQEQLSTVLATWRRRAKTSEVGRVLTEEVTAREVRKYLSDWHLKTKVLRLTKDRLYGPLFRGWKNEVDLGRSEISSFRKRSALRVMVGVTEKWRTRRLAIERLMDKVFDREDGRNKLAVFSEWRVISEATLHLEGVLLDRVEHMRQQRQRWTGVVGDPVRHEAFQQWHRAFKRSRHLRKLASRVRLLVEGRIIARILDRWCSMALPPLRADTLHRRRCVRQFPLRQARSPSRSQSACESSAATEKC